MFQCKLLTLDWFIGGWWTGAGFTCDHVCSYTDRVPVCNFAKLIIFYYCAGGHSIGVRVRVGIIYTYSGTVETNSSTIGLPAGSCIAALEIKTQLPSIKLTFAIRSDHHFTFL